MNNPFTNIYSQQAASPLDQYRMQEALQDYKQSQFEYTFKQQYNFGDRVYELHEEYTNLEKLKKKLTDTETKIASLRNKLPVEILSLYDQDRSANKLKG